MTTIAEPPAFPRLQFTMADPSQQELVSIVVPCRNEGRFIEACLRSVLAFECPASVGIEVLVMDGCSTDETKALAQKIANTDSRVRVLDNPGRIQSTAVNLGIRAARGTWIMRLDAHARYPANYLRICYETARRSGADNVGGLFITEARGPGYQAQLVQALTTHRFGVGDAGYRTGGGEAWVDTVPYGFFDRRVFERLGWLDERLVRAQDYEFNRRLIAAGGRIRRNPAIRVFYYNQPTLSAFYWKQFSREAPYNAYLWYLAPYAFAVRHAITAVFAAGVIAGPLCATLLPWCGAVYGGLLTLYALLAFISALQQAVRFRRPTHAILLPFCFFAYHFLHGCGVLWGLIRLATCTAPVQKIKEPWTGAGRFRAWPAPSPGSTGAGRESGRSNEARSETKSAGAANDVKP